MDFYSNSSLGPWTPNHELCKLSTKKTGKRKTAKNDKELEPSTTAKTKENTNDGCECLNIVKEKAENNL